MTQFAYAGIGSRETPAHVLEIMATVANELAGRGWTMRSGHAGGADSAFEAGARSANGPMEIFIPWSGFNGGYHERDSVINAQVLPNWITANGIAGQLHPAWNKCSSGAKLLHTRNIYQIAGQDLTSPVNCVVCWTTDGKASGGTGQAMRFAEYLEIPIFNLYSANALDNLAQFVYDTEVAAQQPKPANG